MTPTFPTGHAVNPARRNLLIASGVIVFHVAALWALQSGLLRRTVELMVPVALLSEIIPPPAPRVDPPAPLPEPKPPEPAKPVRKEAKPVPAPLPVARPDPAPAPAAPTGSAQPQAAAPPVAAAVAPPSAAAPAAATKVELPSSDADYLGNPKPRYPPMSKRLGEQGRVVVRVFIGADGKPQKAELKQSSGYGQLDREALDYVMRCRYVPGKLGGVPQAMWHDAPVNFVLDN